jgi:hypothetical protein
MVKVLKKWANVFIFYEKKVETFGLCIEAMHTTSFILFIQKKLAQKPYGGHID